MTVRIVKARGYKACFYTLNKTDYFTVPIVAFKYITEGTAIDNPVIIPVLINNECSTGHFAILQPNGQLMFDGNAYPISAARAKAIK